MRSFSNPRPERLLVSFSLFLAVIASGCYSREQIESYAVPKEKETHRSAAASARPSEAEPPETGAPTHRMLAAILPAGDRAWFFKLVGPLAAVDWRAEEVHKFFTSIRLGDDGRPTWELPAADWQEEQGGGMRAATIRIPADGERLELSVIPAAGSVLSNINRWRGQMKLPDAHQDQLAEFTREIKAGDATITVVDLRGHFDAGAAMMPPFARGAQGQPGQAPQLPPGHPPINGERDGDR